MSEHVKTEINGQVLTITLDRPKANAIDAETSRDMGIVFAEYRDNPDLRVAILTGGGEKFFSAGWDLDAAAEGEDYMADFGVGGFGGISEMHDLNKPVIAAVNGYAVGGGFELALACDMIVSTEYAQFFLPEPRAGTVADSGCLRLTHRLPRAVALEMLLTCRRMDADEARKWGLVNRVVPQDRLLTEAHLLAEEILKSAPLATAATKEIVRHAEMVSIEEGYRILRSGTLDVFEKMLKSEDAAEGALAFTEKRPPVWKGR
ncbi:MAG: enoyl-CoA hydratase-related protein [Rhodospirillales bacterium]